MPGTIWGIGTKHYGKAGYSVDEDKGLEEFDATLWFCIFWLPIIPIKSYRIQQTV